MDFCWQSNVSDFQYAVQVGQNFSSKQQASFIFTAAVTICSDFGAQKNKVSHFILICTSIQFQCAIYFPRLKNYIDALKCYGRVKGLPRWHQCKEPTCRCRKYKRHRFDPQVERSSGRVKCNLIEYVCLIVRESKPRQVDKKSKSPQGERGLEFSRRRKGQFFFPSTFLRII